MNGTKRNYRNLRVGAPIFGKKEIAAVVKCLREGRLSQGKYVKAFENDFAKYMGRKYAVACNSGSSANLLIASVLKERFGLGGSVMVPAATFATAVSPFLQVGFQVVYSDVGLDANINPDGVEKTLKILKEKKANLGTPRFLMVVHSLGTSCDMDRLQEIAHRNKLTIIEDCCESHGATWNGKKIGNFGLMSSFSFFVAHNITSGEGGIVVTDDKQCYDLLRSFREFGRKINPRRWRHILQLGFYDERYQFDRLGYNFRMTDYTASFAREQLKKLDRFNQHRKRIVNYLNKRLQSWAMDKKFIILPREVPGNLNAHYGYLIIIQRSAPFVRKEIIQFLERKGIETRPFFAGFLPFQLAFKRKGIAVDPCPVAKLIHKNAFFIGCHPGFSRDDVKYIGDTFEKFFKQYI